MTSPIFKRTYFIIDCDEKNKITRSFSQPSEKSVMSNLIGQDISKIIIKKEDTEQNVNFYQITGIKDKIFNVDLFKISDDPLVQAESSSNILFSIPK